MRAPLWTDPERRTYPTLDGDLEVDVAIVGAGFSGLGAAWALRDSGLRVVVLEWRAVASGASGRNAGFLLAGPAMGFRRSTEAVGWEQTLQIWELTDRNHDTLARIIRDHGVSCGFLRRGSMSLAASAEEWQDMQEEQAEMEVAGIASCVVPRNRLPIPLPDRYAGGVYHAGNGELNPGDFLRGVAEAVHPTVMIFESTRVESVERDTCWRLHTPAGIVRAESLILATNAYTDTLLPGSPIAPTRGQVLSTEPLDRVATPFPMYANHGYQYWRQTADGRLVVGGWRDLDIPREVGTREALNQSVQDALTAFTAYVAGPATGTERRWAGIMGFTPDHFPLVGAVPGQSDLFVAAGYSGHGVAMAFTCGALVAERSVGQPVAIPPAFDPARFTPAPGV